MEAFVMLVVVLVVFGPLLVIVPGVLILCAIGLFSGDGPRRARATFECPVRRSRVTADFAVPVGAAKPGSVTACSAFQDPSRSRAPSAAWRRPMCAGPRPSDCSAAGP